jgi:N-hydroxyarylamine O-acetyltransferase
MEPGRESRQFARTYRVMAEGGAFVLQSRRSEEWLDLYAFTLEPSFPVDHEVSNHYTSTHPSSRFLRGPIAQRPTPAARYMLHGREFVVERGGETTTRELADDEDLLRILATAFGLDFPPGTHFGPVAP